MALNPRDGFLRTQEDKATGADPRDGYLRTQEDKVAAAEGFTADGTIDLPSLTSIGAALTTYDADGQVDLPLLTSIGTALSTYNADGQIDLPSITVTGVAARTANFGDLIKTNRTANPGVTIVGDLGSNPTAGNLLIVGFSNSVSANTFDTPPTGFILLHAENSGTAASWAWYYKISNGTEQTASMTFGTTGQNEARYNEYEWDGSIPTITKNENVDNISTATSSQPSGAVTPANSHNIVIAGHASDSASSNFNNQAIDGSWIEDNAYIGSSYPGFKFSRLVNVTGSQEATHSDTDSGAAMWGVIASFDVLFDGSGQIDLPSPMSISGLASVAYDANGQPILPSISTTGLAAIVVDIGQETVPTPFGGNQNNSASIDCGTNGNRFLAVHIAWYEGPPSEDISVITYNGQTLTEIVRRADVNLNVSVWYGIVNPASGSNTLVVNFDVEPQEGPVIAAHPLYNVVQTSVAAAIRDTATNVGVNESYSSVLTGIQASDLTLAGVYNYSATLNVSWSTLTEKTDANFTGAIEACEGSTATDLGVSTCTADVSAESAMTAFALINDPAVGSDASGNITLPLISTIGSSNIEYTGIGAFNLPALLASGAALLTLKADGQIILPIISTVGLSEAVVLFDADGQIILPSLATSGDALDTYFADGQFVLPGLTIAGAAKIALDADGQIILPTLSIAGLAKTTYTADGQIALSILAISGDAQVVYAAEGQFTLPALILSGLAGTGIIGDGQIALPSLTIDGSAAIALDGIGTVVFPAIVVAGNSDVKYTGVGTPVFVGIEISGMTDIDYTATGLFNLPIIDIAGVAGSTVSGDAIGDVHLPAINFNGISLATHIAIGNIFLPNIIIGGDTAAFIFSKPYTSDFTVPFTIH